MKPFRDLYPHADLLLKETTTIAEKVIVLPTGTSVGLDDIGQICQVMRTAIGHAV